MVPAASYSPIRVLRVELVDSVPELSERKWTCPGAVSANENHSSSDELEKLARMCCPGLIGWACEGMLFGSTSSTIWACAVRAEMTKGMVRRCDFSMTGRDVAPLGALRVAAIGGAQVQVTHGC